MKLKTGQYSENFWASEFDYVQPERLLLTVLERMRIKTEDNIIITNGPRTPRKHVSIYKKLEKEGKLGGKKWYDVIPWGSRHLAKFGKDLRAVDIKAVKKRDINGRIMEYYSGAELHSLLKEIEEELRIFLGIGVGKYYCHFDIDRERSTVWYYS